jgi:RNA polymerase sigma factor (sigma-70 family)
LEAFLWLPRLREPAAFVVWLRWLLVKHSDRVARRRRVHLLPLGELPEIAATSRDPLAVIEAREIQRLVRSALATLPEAQRRVAILFYLSQHPQADIAAMLGIPLGTVKKRLYDARRRLRAVLDQPVEALGAPQLLHTRRALPRRQRSAPALPGRGGAPVMHEQTTPRILPFGAGFVSMETGKRYERTPAGALAVVEVWPRWKRIALAQGVDLETLRDPESIFALAAYYSVRLSLETAEWMARQYARTEEISALLIALSRVQALAAIPDGQLYDDHLTYLWAASSGLAAEPAWAYQVAREIAGPSV